MDFHTRVGELYGVGEKYKKVFSQNHIETVEDLLYYFPRAYQNRGDIFSLWGSACDNAFHSYILTIATEPKVAKIRRGMELLKFRAFDESGSVNITYFNQNYLKDVFKIGATFRFFGKINQKKRTLEMTSPQYEPYSEEKPLLDFVPVYPLFAGINQKYLVRLQKSVHDGLLGTVSEFMPKEILNERGLCTLYYALSNIHFPESAEALQTAIKRLSFDELFLFALSLSQLKTENKTPCAPNFRKQNLNDFLSLLPYELTSGQKEAIVSIENDCCKESGDFITPMNRIVVGDVGCGKTVVAGASVFLSCKNGYQSALMVPTEILANQHFETLAPLFEKCRIPCALLTGSTPAKQKKEILDGLKKGTLPFVIGTHALLQDTVTFEKLGLVITDEQHRFGVNQRATLSEKSTGAHVLVMSATPIPRTLSLMLYKDLDTSYIRELPPGRQKVDTFTVDETYRERLNGFIRKQVKNGNQVYIVCPSVEETKKEDIDNQEDYNPFEKLLENDTPPLKSAVDYAKELQENVFPDLKIAFLHGKLKGKEKDEIMLRFARREIDILVSTTVIEVGVNVPNATLMIVENAERFGLSQLHQLRGRVGRGKDKSYCILVSDSKSEKAKERLEVLHKVYDGYTIAEYDLKMRGPGDFFSQNDKLRQSGDLGLNLSKSCDTDLLREAFESAEKLLSSDPTLSGHIKCKEKVENAFQKRTHTMN